MLAFTDLETVGTEDPDFIAEISATITAPGNYSKPESIAKWEAENKPALLEEALRKTSFDGGLGRIVCIGIAVDDGVPMTFAGEEKQLIAGFYSHLIHEVGAKKFRPGQAPVMSDVVMVGHNILGFDMRFLYQRSVVNGIKPPKFIKFDARPWDTSVRDTMLMWNPDRDKKVSLDKLCRILGVKSPKGELDGSKVWQYYRGGRIEEIRSYCAGDIVAMRECYKRMAFE